MPCGTARLLVLVAFIVLVNPLYLLGLWLGLKLFSLFTNFLSTMRIWCFRFFSVARRNAPHTHTHYDEAPTRNHPLPYPWRVTCRFTYRLSRYPQDLGNTLKHSHP